jgi:sulfite exporter TauE/SafE
MDSVIFIYWALSLGLLSNLHCIGMCGPLSLALPLDRSSYWTISGGIFTYTLGRSLGYAGLGILVGIIGLTADIAGALQWLSIISGAFIILFAWRGYYSFTPKLAGFNAFIGQKLGQLFKKQSEQKSTRRLLGIGILNAYLPCGMVYVAMLSALNTGSIQHAALFMFFFGIGTLPGFIGLALLRSKITHVSLFNNKAVIASLITGVGILIILRGMNLGIPMISPKTDMTEVVHSDDNQPQSEEVTMSCCSKKDTATSCESEE